MIKHQISTGKVLLADPFMQDSNFKRAAILLTDYSEDGSVGFILNKQLDMNIEALVADFPDFDSVVFYGGPVQTDTIHYIHNLGDVLEKSTKIGEDIYWGGDFKKLKVLIGAGVVQPENIRFYVGYSGWSEGQLEEELEGGSWVLADMDADYLFEGKHEELWTQIMNSKGNAFEVIAQMPEGIDYN
ncbi:MAG: putative transcriptional regulator [Paraglaciecola sp.]|jgi:putative transcriptional regulator